jgi:hypothetical protein
MLPLLLARVNSLSPAIRVVDAELAPPHLTAVV